LLFSALLLFAYSESFLGTVINVIVSARGQRVTIGPAFAFSLVVLGFSGVWPLVKLALLTFSWVASTETLSVDARERLLRFLDEYGKYSLLDTFLSVVALESYRMKWRSDSDDISVLVDPVPEMAFFTFVLASVISLLVGHVTTYVHRVTVERDHGCGAEAARVGDEEPRALVGHATSLVQAAAIAAALALAGAAVVVGAFTTSFDISTSGVLSSLILDPVRERRSYSLISLGMAVMEGKGLQNFGCLMIQQIFFMFTLTIPLALVFLLLALWFAPMSASTQQRLLEFGRCLDAWASFDVFALAVVVARFQFGRMASFMVYHDNIEPICTWVRSNLNSECFHIECTFARGFSVLAFAGVVSYMVPKFAFQACESAMEQRLLTASFESMEYEDFATEANSDDEASSDTSPAEDVLCGLR